VLLSDAGLPVETGWSLIETIRRMTPENGGRIPAVALTAYAYPHDVEHSLASGFDAHLSKPVEMSLVVSTIARLAGRSDLSTGGGSV
jgi:two-component system, chemotaxis family, CheB/CheR fusion protein